MITVNHDSLRFFQSLKWNILIFGSVSKHLLAVQWYSRVLSTPLKHLTNILYLQIQYIKVVTFCLWTRIPNISLRAASLLTFIPTTAVPFQHNLWPSTVALDISRFLPVICHAARNSFHLSYEWPQCVSFTTRLIHAAGATRSQRRRFERGRKENPKAKLACCQKMRSLPLFLWNVRGYGVWYLSSKPTNGNLMCWFLVFWLLSNRMRGEKKITNLLQKPEGRQEHSDKTNGALTGAGL